MLPEPSSPQSCKSIQRSNSHNSATTGHMLLWQNREKLISQTFSWWPGVLACAVLCSSCPQTPGDMTFLISTPWSLRHWLVLQKEKQEFRHSKSTRPGARYRSIYTRKARGIGRERDLDLNPVCNLWLSALRQVHSLSLSVLICKMELAYSPSKANVGLSEMRCTEHQCSNVPGTQQVFNKYQMSFSPLPYHPSRVIHLFDR